MNNLLLLLLLLIELYTSKFGTIDPAYVQEIMNDMQTIGMTATIENIKYELEQAGVRISSDDGSISNTSLEEAISQPDTSSKKAPREITDYKKELVDLGYYREDSDDNALNLRNAILRFQSDCNLVVDGIWGPNSMDALKQRLNSSSGICNDVIKAPPTTGKWIVINKTKRILTLYENTTIIGKYPIAIGNPPSLTPNGKFVIVSKVINPSWGGGGYAKPVKGGVPENPLGYRWMGLSYKSGSELGIHGNNSPYSIGKNISHGCIRMINSDVEQLFEIVPYKAPVWIGTDETLKELGIIQERLPTGE